MHVDAGVGPCTCWTPRPDSKILWCRTTAHRLEAAECCSSMVRSSRALKCGTAACAVHPAPPALNSRRSRGLAESARQDRTRKRMGQAGACFVQQGASQELERPAARSVQRTRLQQRGASNVSATPGTQGQQAGHALHANQGRPKTSFRQGRVLTASQGHTRRQRGLDHALRASPALMRSQEPRAAQPALKAARRPPGAPL